MDPVTLAAPETSDGSAQFPDDAEITPGAPPSIEALLNPKQPMHGKVLQRLKARFELSERVMAGRYDTFDRVDEKRRLYVNLARPARKGDGSVNPDKKEMPFERAIVMPLSYAMHETRKAEIFSQYAFRAPFTQLDGRGIEDIKPAKMAEIKLEYDFQESDGPLSVYSLIQDADAYGMGVVTDTWEEVSGWTSQPPDPMQVMISQALGQPPPEPTQVWGPIKQFTRWNPVDPYLFRPDPRVPRGRLQDGEFAGHRSFGSAIWLKERDEKHGGNYFNVEFLSKEGSAQIQSADTRVSARTRGAMDAQQYTLRSSTDEKDKGFYVLDTLFIKITPKEWGLGDGDDPEIWWFVIADERIIVRAHKSPYQHQQFPYACGETNYDIHQHSNPGAVEMLDGIQRVTDWLVNSRIENVRKFLNDMILFSPEMIEQDDLLHPGTARWIRYTPEGTLALLQGLSADSMLKQFKVDDVTGTHFDIANFLADYANKLGAANDTMQGQTLPDKRTLGEINNAVAAGSKRLSVTAKILDSMAFKPLATRAVMNAQQFYDLQQWVRIAGDYAEIDPENLGRIQMSRADLAGNFDYVPMSALTPQDPARMLSVWNQLYNLAVSNPALSAPDPIDPQVLNLKKLFKMVARLGGAREVDTLFQDLPMQPGVGAPGVLPDEQIQQGVQSGNLAPVESGYSGGMAANLGG